MDPDWLGWAKRLQAIAQNGLTFSRDPFDVQRYTLVRDLAAEIMAHGSGTEILQIRELFAEQVGYATPKVDVRGVVFRDQRILLVRERLDGGWTLPGGWVDVCESPSESVAREIREESGYLARPLKLLAVYDRSKHPHVPPLPFHIYKLFFLCELLGGEASPSLETSDVGFFAEDEIPPLSISRTTEAQLVRMFAHLRHPHWPADFD